MNYFHDPSLAATTALSLIEYDATRLQHLSRFMKLDAMSKKREKKERKKEKFFYGENCLPHISQQRNNRSRNKLCPYIVRQFTKRSKQKQIIK